MNSRLYKKAHGKGFSPGHVAEVGVWHPETSNIYRFIKDGVRTTLVEPDPDSIARIKKEFAADNITLHEVAIYDSTCKLELCKREASTFVSKLPSSPTLVNDDFDKDQAETFTVDAVLFNTIDDGSIELISIDTEGSEWYVLQNMISRPAIISIETHGGMYINPFIDEINTWLSDNRYTLWYQDKSDSVYLKSDEIPVSLFERIQQLMMGLYLYLRNRRKRLKRFLKNL